MKILLVVTAVGEASTGLLLLALPDLVGSLLLGASPGSPAALVMIRVGGAALLGIGAACWMARNDGQSATARGLLAALVLYNLAASAVLAHAGTVLGLSGIGLWPAVFLHAALAVWCVACLQTRPRTRP
jgi:hypothetical protein